MLKLIKWLICAYRTMMQWFRWLKKWTRFQLADSLAVSLFSTGTHLHSTGDHTGFISLCVDLFACICMYFLFYYILHNVVLAIVSTVGWTWWDWSLVLRTHHPSLLWHCWLGHFTRKNPSPIWPIMCLVRRRTLLNLNLVSVYYCTETLLRRTFSIIFLIQVH